MDKKKIAIVNGPNLNLLGHREPAIYGKDSMESCLAMLREAFPDIAFSYHQSNVEGELVNILQAVGFQCDGVVLNAGGYTHTSVAIRDAVSAISAPVVEVHVSNIFAREEFRHTSLLSPVCRGSIIGLGLMGYRLAVEALTE